MGSDGSVVADRVWTLEEQSRLVGGLNQRHAAALASLALSVSLSLSLLCRLHGTGGVV